MRRMRKLWLAGAVATAMTITAACGGGDESTADSDTGSGGNGGEDASDAADLTMWHIQTQFTDMMDAAGERFEAANPGSTVDITAIENDAYKTQIGVALGANEPPCIFISWGGGPLNQYVAADQVVDLTDYLAEDDFRDRFVEVSFDNVTVDDRVYGVPVENVSAAFIWYNKEIFAEHNITPPATWTELLNVVDTLNAAGVHPFSLANAEPWTGSMYYMYLVDRIGGPESFQAAADRQGGSFEDETFVQAGEMLQELVDRAGFNPGFNGLDWGAGQSRALLYSGDAAMELMGNWTVSNIIEENPDFFDNNLGFFPFPAVEGGAGDPTNVLGTVGNNYYHVSSTCESPDQAFEMITYLVDEESVQAREDLGRILPLADFVPDDPFVQEVFEATANADSVQLWYDQYLPPEVANEHLEAVQALFEGAITPEEKAARLESAAASYFD